MGARSNLKSLIIGGFVICSVLLAAPAQAANISPSAIISLTNVQRQSAGLPALTENSVLDQAATAKAADMVERGYWAHFAPDGTSPWSFFTAAGYSYQAAGENLARDFNTSADVMTGWMNSPAHRANILKPNYTEVGVTVLNSLMEGRPTTLVVAFYGLPAGQSAASQPIEPTRTPKSNWFLTFVRAVATKVRNLV